ncbi:Cyclin-dependent kinase G-2 [Pelomyxa schiedti]|nr:Cyclin-dependent kinase G-2 [Pelomyxa schiedti]
MGTAPTTTLEFLVRAEQKSGTYGVVYKARDMMTDEIVALKKLRMEREKEGFPMTALREIKILKELSHQNIVNLREVVVGELQESLFLVFDYADHDLALLLDSVTHPFSESEIKCLMIQLLTGLAYLHDHWVIHRDVKSSNLLYTNKGQLKLADMMPTFKSRTEMQRNASAAMNAPVMPNTGKEVGGRVPPQRSSAGGVFGGSLGINQAAVIEFEENELRGARAPKEDLRRRMVASEMEEEPTLIEEV